MNAAKQIAKYERLAEVAHKLGAYKCAKKWSAKVEELEAAMVVEEVVEVKAQPQIEIYKDTFYTLGGSYVPRAVLLPQIAAKIYWRSYGEGNRAIQRAKDAASKHYKPAITEWLLAN